MKLDDATRYQLLKLIAEHPGYTQRELAAAMGVSVGKTNFCIKALISKGLVKAAGYRRGGVSLRSGKETQTGLLASFLR